MLLCWCGVYHLANRNEVLGYRKPEEVEDRESRVSKDG